MLRFMDKWGWLDGFISQSSMLEVVVVFNGRMHGCTKDTHWSTVHYPVYSNIFARIQVVFNSICWCKGWKTIWVKRLALHCSLLSFCIVGVVIDWNGKGNGIPWHGMGKCLEGLCKGSK